MHEMKLVIAEKPSVAQSLARVIGADKRQDGYDDRRFDVSNWTGDNILGYALMEVRNRIK